MSISVSLPTIIHFGENAVLEHAECFRQGKKALIVTGKSGARLSGALADVEAVLDEASIEYLLFDRIGENPLLDTCLEAGDMARADQCDFVIAIGGGSAIDAAKAIAALAVNPISRPMDIYDPGLMSVPSLPLLAIPTTAGTGSEVNYYSVLTLSDRLHKKTFKSPHSWPKYAFLDPKYTFSLPYGYSVSCALDAFAHCIESYLSPKSNPVSSATALEAGKAIYGILRTLPRDLTEEDREVLLAGSCAAGYAISITGTGFPHPLGYSLTLMDGLPHGKACAVFTGDFLEKNAKTPQGSQRIREFCSALQASPEEVGRTTLTLADFHLSLDEKEIQEHLSLVESAGNYTNSPYVISREEMTEIYRKHFL